MATQKELIDSLNEAGFQTQKNKGSGVVVRKKLKPATELSKLGKGVRRFQRELYPVKKQKTLTVSQVKQLIRQGAQQERFQQQIPMQRFQQVQPQQVQQPSMIRSRVNQMQQGKPQIHNFFAHKTEMEIYGDEGLTFFDSNKSRRSEGRTGSLFGI